MRSRFVIILSALVAGCVGRPAPPPPSPPAPAPVAPVVAAPRAVVQEWIDRPLTPGDWTYVRSSNGTRADYGAGATASVFSLSCEGTSGAVIASRPGRFEAGVTGAMILTATTGSKTYPAVNGPSDAALVISRIAPTDPHLDAIAFSRGRFMISVRGGADLILPTWPEITRVIEDCRR